TFDRSGSAAPIICLQTSRNRRSLPCRIWNAWKDTPIPFWVPKVVFGPNRGIPTRRSHWGVSHCKGIQVAGYFFCSTNLYVNSSPTSPRLVGTNDGEPHIR